MLYTYAFLPLPSRQQLTSLGTIWGFSHAIQLLIPAHSGIAAAVEPLTTLTDLQESDETLLRFALRHDQVICQLFKSLAVLPLDFGTCFRSADKLQMHLQHHHLAYLNRLDLIQGRAEYRLTAKLLLPAWVVLDQTQPWLSPYAIQELQSVWPTIWPSYSANPQGLESIRSYFLLSPGEYQEALQLSKHWMQDHPTWQLNWTTALPPYHFV